MMNNFMKFMKKLQFPKKEKSEDYDVIWIKRGHKARGKIMINDNK